VLSSISGYVTVTDTYPAVKTDGISASIDFFDRIASGIPKFEYDGYKSTTQMYVRVVVLNTSERFGTSLICH